MEVYRTFVSHKAKQTNIAATAEHTNEQNTIAYSRQIAAGWRLSGLTWINCAVCCATCQLQR